MYGTLVSRRSARGNTLRARGRGGVASERHSQALAALVRLVNGPGPRPTPAEVAQIFVASLGEVEAGGRVPAARLVESAHALEQLAGELKVLVREAPEGEPPATDAATYWLHLTEELLRTLSTRPGLGYALIARVEEERRIPPVRAELAYGAACCAAIASALRMLGTARTDTDPGVH